MAPPLTRNNLSAIRDKLSPDGKLIVNAITSELQALSTQLNNQINSEIQKLRDEFCALLSRKNDEVDELKLELNSVKNEVKVSSRNVEDLKFGLDEEDSYVRRETLIFSGADVPVVQAN